jgi:predicted ATPase/transcriptional regulator with XRE-family HTH domain
MWWRLGPVRIVRRPQRSRRPALAGLIDVGGGGGFVPSWAWAASNSGSGPGCVLLVQVVAERMRGDPGTVAEPPSFSFAGLLRQLRTEADLTQEELAEAAGLSPRSVSDLERGINRTARKDTALLLANALSLTGPVRELFVAAARGRAPAVEVLAVRTGATTPASAAPAAWSLRQEVPGVPPPARHNLPAPLTSFLDRKQDVARLHGLLSEGRLVTLTGTGGIGKTRLALQAGAQMVERFPDGVWLAELAGIADPGLVTAQVMQALGVRQQGDAPALDALIYRLRSAKLLLVLDNCEHLLDACAQLAGALLRAAPGLHVLATSRELLGISGEVACPVRPLDLPSEAADAREAGQAAAVQLFLDRGSAVWGGTGGRVAPVAVAERICRKLDGLPLAIELAAARLGTLSAAEIEAHLEDRFRFLAYRRPAADPRHQALRAAMDWSYELLSAEERRVLGELSVFAGTFGLPQVAEVCTGADHLAALEVIDRLASKSLVAAEPAEDGTRYRLLDTVRHYAADRLADVGGTEDARQRHAAAFLSLAERERELAVLAREQDNFRAALGWSLAQGDQTGPRLAWALGDFWLGLGLLQEGRGWLERALAEHPSETELRAGLLRLLGMVLWEVADLNGAEAVLAESLRTATAAGAPALQARIRVHLAELHKVHNLPGGDDAGALEECEAAIAVLEAEGDLEGLAEAWLLTGRLRFFHGDSPADQEAFERAIVYAKRSGNHRAQVLASHALGGTFVLLPIPADAAVTRVEQLLEATSGEPWAEAGQLMALSHLYAYAGRIADARAAAARSRALFNRCGAKLGLAYTAFTAGMTELLAGDPAAAERYLREGYEAFSAMGEQGYLCNLAAMLAEALYALGRLDEAEQMTDEAQAGTAPNDTQLRVRLQSTRARLLAQRGQFSAARELLDEAAEVCSPTAAVERAGVLMARAEVEWLAGAPDQASASLRAALGIYEDRHVVPLADLAKAALAGFAAELSGEQA